MTVVRQLAALIVDTLRHAWSKKVFVGLFLNGTIALVFLLWYLRTIASRTQYSSLSLLAQADPRYLDPAYAAKMLLGSTVWFAFWIQTAFGFLLLMGLLALVLDPGRNAFLAATPVSRPLILIGRFLGCLAVAAPGILYPMVAAWIAARREFGLWHTPFLAGIPTTLLAIAALLAMMVLLQVLTNSTAIVLALTMLLGVIDVCATQPEMSHRLLGSSALTSFAGNLALFLPRTSEIAQWTASFVQSGIPANSTALWTTSVSTVAALTGASVLFSRKEF